MRRAAPWLLAGLVVACMLVPDALLATPSTARVALTGAVAVLVAGVLAIPALRDGLTGLLRRRATAYVMLGAWAAIGLGVQVLKVRGLYDLHGQDHAYHVQVLWNTLDGRFGEGSALQELYFDPPLRNHMGLHVSPAYFSLLPVFALAPHVGTLLVAKVAAAALSALLLLRLAGGLLDRATATLVMGAYLLHPTVLGQWTHDFYPAVLAGPPLVAAFLAWERRRLGWFTVALVALLSVREDLALTACAFAVVAAAERVARSAAVGNGMTPFRGWRWAALPAAIGVSWYVVATRIVMPYAGGDGVAANVAAWYSGFGDTPGEIVRTMLTDPIHTLTVAFASAKLLYLWQLLRPFAALPLLGRAALVAGPTLAVNLLVTTAGPTTDPTGHYSVVAAAALAVATVAALGHITATRGAGAATAVALVVLGAGLTAVPDSVNATSLARLRRPPHAEAVEAALALIPAHSTVAAPSDFLSRVACAPRVYAVDRFGCYPADLGRPEAVVLDLDPDRAHVLPDRRERYAARIEEFQGDPGYERAFERDGIVLLLRRDRSRVSQPGPEQPSSARD